MKKVLVLFLLASVTFKGLGQQISPADHETSDKSKRLKTTAVILLATGGGLIATSFIIPKGEFTGYNSDYPFNKEYKNDGIRSIICITGVVMSLTSVGFFISAHKAKKKETRLSFKNETMPQIMQGSFVNRYVPSLALTVRL